MNQVILIGDEVGLKSLYNSVCDNDFLTVKGVICHKGRIAAEEVASEICRKLKCALLLQPRRSEIVEYELFCSNLRDLKADVAFCYSYDMILSKDILSLFPDGIYNLHGALLPKYRGGNVLNWVIINGEEETGVTIHRMVEKVDAGPIVLQKKVSIGFEDTALLLRNKIFQAGDELLLTFWRLYVEKKLATVQQKEDEATYFPKRKPEDGYFEWSWDAEKIYNMIRALVFPWPGAFYIENGEKIVINCFMTLEEVIKMKREKESK